MKNQIECLKELFNGKTLVNISSGEKIKYHPESGEIIRVSDDKAIEPDFSCPDVWHVSRGTEIGVIDIDELQGKEVWEVLIKQIEKINKTIEAVNRLDEKIK
jgi:hypothetical protein